MSVPIIQVHFVAILQDFGAVLSALQVRIALSEVEAEEIEGNSAVYVFFCTELFEKK